MRRFGRSRSIHRPDNSHKCKISDKNSKSFLPTLSHRASIFKKFGRCVKKSTLISDTNPQSMEYYRSQSEIYRLRRAHIEAGTCIIHPFSNFRSFYEIWMSAVLLIVIFYFPGDGAFDWANKAFQYDYAAEYVYVREREDIFENILRIFCGIDILMTFFTGYTIPARHKVIMNAKKVARHYVFSKHFILDVLTSVPFGYFFEGPKLQRTLDIFSFLKIARLPTLSLYLNNSLDFFNIKLSFIRIGKNIIIHFLVFHWFACLVFVVPQLEYFVNDQIATNSWIERADLPQKQLLDKYILSFYTAVGSLLGIKLQRGNVELVEEKVVFVFAFLFGKIYVLYITVQILNFLLGTRSLETKYYEVLSQIKAYMTKKQLPLSMQTRLLQFYDYKYNKKFFKEKRMIGLLSEKLKGEINLSICSKLVQDVSLLAELPQYLLEQVVVSLKLEIYLPNDVIIKAGSVGDCMYFLASGTVAVWTPSGKEVCHLEDGAFFGEISLVFKDKRRTANIVALETCEVYKLDRRVFRNCFKSDPHLLKMLEDVANERLEITQMYEDAHAKTFLDL